MAAHEFAVTIKVPRVEVDPQDTSVKLTPFERARLVALKQAGYHVDPSVNVLTSADRKYNGKVLRTHLVHEHDVSWYRFKTVGQLMLPLNPNGPLGRRIVARVRAERVRTCLACSWCGQTHADRPREFRWWSCVTHSH